MDETTTQRLVRQYRNVLGLPSDRQVAIKLGVHAQAVSKWVHGQSHAEPEYAEKMAETLGLPVLQVLAAIEADRAYKAESRRIWARYGKGAFLALVALLGTAPSTNVPGVQLVPARQSLTVEGPKDSLCAIMESRNPAACSSVDSHSPPCTAAHRALLRPRHAPTLDGRTIRSSFTRTAVMRRTFRSSTADDG
jgi:transcriptional regulator with XRE-family HTH domain